MNDDLRERLDALEDATDDTSTDPVIAFERPEDGVLLDAPGGDRLPHGTDPAIILPGDIWGER